MTNPKFHNLIIIIDGFYGWFIAALAGFSAILLAFIFIIIVYDVSLRTFGFYPPIWTSSFTEYALFYITILAAPWVLRHHGHITILSFLNYMPQSVKILLVRLAYVIGALACGLLAWLSLKIVITINGYDIRAFAVPRWAVLAGMPLGFSLLSIEFVRHAAKASFKLDSGAH